MTRERSSVRFAHPGGRGATRLPYPSSLGLGDRWGCVAFAAEWQCWDARGGRPWLTGLKARRVPWLANRMVRIEADRVCTRGGGSTQEQCWNPPAQAGGPGTELPAEVRPPSPEGLDLTWGVLPPGPACSIQHGAVVCKGPGYSPADDLDRPVMAQFEPAVPVVESAVVTLAPSATWDGDCLVRRGCGRAPIVLSRCGFFAMGQSWSDVLPEAESLYGEKVSVKGVLGVAAVMSYAMGCDQGCCNETNGPIVLAGATDVLGLKGLWCHGDDSELCCDAPAYGQTVIATGRLVPETESQVLGAWMLQDPEICIVSP